MKRRVGFIGLGDQGAPMAVALAERHDLHVWARREASYEELGAVRFSRAHDPEELARGIEILCLCLPGDVELEDLLLNRKMANALPAGGVVINHATGDPSAAERISGVLAQIGISYLDAPVSGGRPGAVARSLTCFVGGENSTLEACRRVIECHSQTIAFMGRPGSGQMAKLFNNILTVSNLRNVVETLSLAQAAGIDLRALQEALARSSGGSFILQAIGRQISLDIAEHIAALNRKDVAEFAGAMRARGLDPRRIVDWAATGPDGLPALVYALAAPAHSTPEAVRS